MRTGMILAPWSVEARAASTGDVSFQISKAKLVTIVLLFRVFYLFAMATSCYLIPEHNPGDGVLRFDMRFNSAENHCFCLKGHACDYGMTNDAHGSNASIGDCAIPSVVDSLVEPNAWKFLLTPLTKWDAARFLALAVDPSLRDPKPSPSSHDPFGVSEQAHAFLPMFPWVMQQLALLFHRIVPSKLLPPTFESLVVFAGMILNNFVCLPVTILAMYSLTRCVMASRFAESMPRARQDHHHSVAIVVCLVFGVWNPALVFFCTNYSESFFATSTLLGHLCLQKSKLRGSILLRFTGIACWMIGSYTRSNGTLHCLWLLQDGLARILLLHRKKAKSNSTALAPMALLVGQTVAICIQSILDALLVALPVRYHDWKGWERHCVGSGARPLWCSNSNESTSLMGASFSLYRHIQDKHWNVGFLRYYEWKQIPNFLLAAPVLMLSIAGSYQWIHWSLIKVYGKGKAPLSYKPVLVGWPIHALSESVCISGTTVTSEHNKTLWSESRLLLENPLLLGHYAILSILAVLGLTIAHVQISTRMICSTSPAVIWFMAHSLLRLPSEGNSNGFFSSLLKSPSKLIWGYVGLYMFLGVILHVNFLPWT